MRHKGLTRFALAAALVLLAAPAFSESFPLDVELGYRFVSVSGNEEMYRSQINEREGFLLRSLTLSTADFGGSSTMFDKFRLDVSDIGAGPAGAIRLEVGKSEIYRFRFRYARWQHFSALPGFANPMLASGIVPGQQTYERLRNVYDAELEIMPGKVFTPIVGFTYNRYTGPSNSTIRVGEDEFRLNQSFESYDAEPRVGFALNAGNLNVNFLQGWRKYHEVETSVLTPGAGAGNGSTAILGQQQTLISYSRTATTDVNIPVTTASAAYQLGCWAKLSGTYVRASGMSDTQGPTDLDGTLVGFDIQRFFGGLNETVSSSVDNSYWRGAVRADVTVLDGVELTGGWRKRHRELTGFELLSQIFYNTSTYGGASAPNVSRVLNIHNGLERTDETFDAGLVLRKLGPFGLRGGWGQTKQTTELSEAVAEIVVPGGQSGIYDRKVNTYDAGLTFAMWGITLGAEYRGDKAEESIVRSDFTSRNTWRARASWDLKKFVRISGSGLWVEESNDTAGINSRGNFSQYGGDFILTPITELSLRFSGSRYRADTYMPILNPINFATIPSAHLEDGYALEGGLGLNFKVFKLEASGGEFKNTGSFGFKIDRFRGRVEIPLVKAFALVGEWAYDKYTETVYTYGDYKANRYGVYARWSAF